MIEILSAFSPVRMDGYIALTVPLVLFTSGGLLELGIKETEDGYKVFTVEDMFSEQNMSAEFYFGLFMKEQDENNYNDHNMKIKDGVIYSEYQSEASPVVAISEFIRFFARLDDFIINGKILGNEENFY